VRRHALPTRTGADEVHLEVADDGSTALVGPGVVLRLDVDQVVELEQALRRHRLARAHAAVGQQLADRRTR
jgi:hypothetical protein